VHTPHSAKGLPIIDLSLEELKRYVPPLTKQPDFDEFWRRTIEESAREPLNAEFMSVPYPVDSVKVFKVFYRGFKGARVCGWYIVPRGRTLCPALLFLHGYSGNKGQVFDYLGWALQGYAVLAIDVRGQSGESTDPGRYSSGHVTGWMTKGIMSPEEYYYRGAYIDCIRALDLLEAREEVDKSRIGVSGISQGGGLALATVGLDRRPVLAMPDIPYLCHFRRGVEISLSGPYLEIVNYLRVYPGNEEAAFRTLSYFDPLNMAESVACQVLMSVGLRDPVCPPSTVFAVYNRLKCRKELKVYPFTEHEVIGAHAEEKVRTAKAALKP